MKFQWGKASSNAIFDSNLMGVGESWRRLCIIKSLQKSTSGKRNRLFSLSLTIPDNCLTTLLLRADLNIKSNIINISIPKIARSHAFSCNVATNIGENFSLLLDKHFLKTQNFNKTFNQNNVVMSKNSMPNFSVGIKPNFAVV